MSFPGAELQARRLETGLTREDVHRKLRVPADFVRSLEEGTLELLPSSIYTVGFTRTYCTFLGLNPEPYVEALLMGKQTRWKLLDFGLAKNPSKRPAWFGDIVTWAAILAIAALSWATYTAVVRPGASQDSGRVQAGTLDLRVPLLRDPGR